jgi:GTP-binding protein
MTKITATRSDFIASYPSHTLIPYNDRPEIVMLGRSNVGKSTLINRITVRKSLANTGKTPGTTKLINVYEVDLINEQSNTNQFTLLDFPGFGFGKFSKNQRSAISQEVVNYLRNRSHRRGIICLLNDPYRDPGSDELALYKLCQELGWPVVVVITKIDRLNQSERHTRLNAIAQSYDIMKQNLFITGRTQKSEDFWEHILQLS